MIKAHKRGEPLLKYVRCMGVGHNDWFCKCCCHRRAHKTRADMIFCVNAPLITGDNWTEFLKYRTD
jgi:hypothetical protein